MFLQWPFYLLFCGLLRRGVLMELIVFYRLFSESWAKPFWCEKRYLACSRNFARIFFLASLMILRALARWNLKEIELEVVGSVLNFYKAARRRRIACLHSLLNQGLSRLWVVGLCGMHVLAIFMSFSENSRMVSVLFTMRCFWHWERNSSQLVLFNLHRGRSSSWGCKLSSKIG